MIKHAPALKLAINSEEYGERIRSSRILTAPEVKRVGVLKRIRGIIAELGALDSEMVAKLEAAIDNQEAEQSLAKAYLSMEEYLRMGYWDKEGPEFREIDEANAILEFVVREYRSDLRGARIACLFQLKIPPAARRIRLGSAMKLPGKIRHLSEVDAVVTLAFEQWRDLADADRQRLVHHELEHLQTGDEGQLVLVGHDFEDFASIVDLYGLRSVSGRMAMDGAVGAAIERAVGGQREIFDDRDDEWHQPPEAFRRGGDEAGPSLAAVAEREAE